MLNLADWFYFFFIINKKKGHQLLSVFDYSLPELDKDLNDLADLQKTEATFTEPPPPFFTPCKRINFYLNFQS